ncbi:hypothetical protein ES703_17902 [subsurface metagenome]
MQNRAKPPISLAQNQSRPPGVTVTTENKEQADSVATQGLLAFYTQDDGFHCPKCGVVINNPEEAVNHLAEEINKALALLGK